jgi:hypothetical protein
MLAGTAPQNPLVALLSIIFGPALGELLGMAGNWLLPMMGINTGGASSSMTGGTVPQLLNRRRNQAGRDRAVGAVEKAGHDEAHMARVLEGLGLKGTDPSTALYMGGLGNSVISAMLPHFGVSSVTDLIGGLSSDFAGNFYDGTRRMRGASGFGLDAEEVAAVTALVANKARGITDKDPNGLHGGIDFSYTRGYTMGEIGEIGREMGNRSMLKYDPNKAGSVADQAEYEIKNMIDSMDLLRGLWDAPDAPINELFDTLDQMFGAGAGGMTSGNIRNLLREIDLTSSALGVEGKELMANLTDAGQRAQQAGLAGEFGVRMGLNAANVAGAAQRGSLINQTGKMSDITENDVGQYKSQADYSAFNAAGSREFMGAVRLAGVPGMLGEGKSPDSRKAAEILKKAAAGEALTDEETTWITKKVEDNQLTPLMAELGVSPDRLAAAAANTAENQETFGTVRGIIEQGQLNESYDRISAAMGRGDVGGQLGELSGAGGRGAEQRRQLLQEFFEGGDMREEALGELVRRKGLKGVNVGALWQSINDYTQSESVVQTRPGDSKMQVMAAFAGNKQSAEEIASQKRVDAAIAVELEKQGITGGRMSATTMAQRLMTGIVDPNSDMTAGEALKKATSGVDAEMLNKVAAGEGSVGVVSELAELDRRMAKYDQASELTKKINEDEAQLKTVKSEGGDTSVLERRIAGNKAARSALGDLDSEQARIERGTLEGQRNALREAHKQAWGEGQVWTDVTKFDAAQEAAGAKQEKLASIERRLEEDLKDNDETATKLIADLMSDYEGSGQYADAGYIEGNFGADARKEAGQRRGKLNKTLKDKDISAAEKLKAAQEFLEAEKNIGGKGSGHAATAARIQKEVADGKMTAEEGERQLRALRGEEVSRTAVGGAAKGRKAGEAAGAAEPKRRLTGNKYLDAPERDVTEEYRKQYEADRQTEDVQNVIENGTAGRDVGKDLQAVWSEIRGLQKEGRIDEAQAESLINEVSADFNELDATATFGKNARRAIDEVKSAVGVTDAGETVEAGEAKAAASDAVTADEQQVAMAGKAGRGGVESGRGDVEYEGTLEDHVDIGRGEVKKINVRVYRSTSGMA